MLYTCITVLTPIQTEFTSASFYILTTFITFVFTRQ